MFVYLIETQVLKEYHKLQKFRAQKEEEKKGMGIRKSYYQFHHGGEMKEESEEKYS